MALSNMQVCALLFSKGTDSTFSCNTRAKVYKKGNGYTNLLNHLMREHPDYERILTPETQLERKMRLGSSSWTSNTTLSPISEDTLALYISRIAKVVEQLFLILSQKLVPTLVQTPLTTTTISSARPGDTLTRYRKLWETVKFMVGDNCSVNQCIGRREGAIPLVGCASHRFNLAVQDFLMSETKLIAKIQALMTKLRTIKGRALLRRVSKLAPLLRNDTRWSSTYAMVKRYVCLEPAISQLGTAWLWTTTSSHYYFGELSTSARAGCSMT
ncbi:hypothetical protein L914_04250 [Phytophthora nicotianae]|uniref:BED-type domain-containing protein n=1 Tax=Phytophthora nicotianae TaxID=4792 RepID=W2NTS0_PHYNI|nr:hypothetical protein L914_04250 [Phytophthora nicotianae]